MRHYVIMYTRKGDRFFELEIGSRKFSNSYSKTAYKWFADIAHKYAQSHNLKRVRDTTVAGYHYVDAENNVFELR